MNASVQGHTASHLNATGPALLSVDQVSLEYRTPQRVVRATHQVSFEIDPADRFILLGPSGCGKSTLLKAVASLGNFPYYLLSNNPNVKTIADFTEKDRIAVPAVGVSVQSRFLQYAAAKQWGDKDFNRLDKYTIAVPHPDATAALIAGGTELSGHFSNPPFQDQALKNPNVHVVLNTYDLLGPNSPTVLFATEKFRNDNPKTYKAFVEALTEAAEFAQSDKAAAADTYIRVTKSKVDRDELLKSIDTPEYEFSVTPKNTYPLAEFLYRVGAIKNKPDSWKDYFFQDAKPLQGS